MKRFISLLLSFCLAIGLCGCEKLSLDNLNSTFLGDAYKFLYEYDSEEVVEIKYEEYEIRNPEFKGCYKALNSKQREIYSRIYAVSEEMPEGFVSLGENYPSAVKDTAIAYKAFLNDNAEIFWMPQTYILGESKKGNRELFAIAFEYSESGSKNQYLFSKNQRDIERKKLKEVCKKVTDKAQTLKGEYEKEKYINDFLCDKITYTEKGENIHTAYGALVNGKALCEGYSRAFKLLCNEVGIECELIVGKAENIGHMWNRVNIDKKLAYVDVTWNDQPYYKTYTYFNITEEQLLKDHILAPLFTEFKDEDSARKEIYNFTYQKCGYTGNSYYEKSDRIIWQDYSKSAANIINEIYSGKEDYVEFIFATEVTEALFYDNPEVFIQNIQNNITEAVITSYANERDTILLFFE